MTTALVKVFQIYNLGAMLANGEGAERDPIEAYKWFSLTATQGNDKARVATTTLAIIDEALGRESDGIVAKAPKVPKAKRVGKRARNAGSLKEAVLKVLTKPMSRQEILSAVQDAGYKFATDKALNSLGTMLYTNKKTFKGKDGKFSAL